VPLRQGSTKQPLTTLPWQQPCSDQAGDWLSQMFKKLDQASFLWQRLNLRSIELIRIDSGQPIQRNSFRAANSKQPTSLGAVEFD
jgi:hypothetical protein